MRWFCVLPGLALAALSGPAALAPCVPDSATLQLWHLDEAPIAGSAASAVSGGVPLAAIANGAALGAESFPGFGRAASTFDGGPEATLSANPNGVPGRDAYLGPLPLANGSGDNSTFLYTGPDGAFSFEAMVFADFGPTNLAVPPDTARYLQILSADGDSTERAMQFRVYWNAANDPTPELQFINIGSPIQTLSALLPLTGSNALARSNWFHVAVTYNGLSNTPGNLKLYWTRVESHRTRADLLASLRMTNALPVTTPDWVIGNEGRATGGSDGNWVGLLDEVRLSSVARDPGSFIFTTDADQDGLPDSWELAFFPSVAAWGANDDPDGDGFSNLAEFAAGARPDDPLSKPGDLDGDGLGDAWEHAHFGSLAPAPDGDPDGDGFSNLQEFQAGTDPTDPLSNPNDSDRDGLPDPWEWMFFGTLAREGAGDFDGDGYSDLQEFQAGSLPGHPRSVPPAPWTRFVPVEDGDPGTSEFGYAGSSSINAVSFIRAALSTVGEQQFLAYYGRHATDAAHPDNNKLVFARRGVGATRWEVCRTPFTANAITDGHDVVSFGIDGDGFLHASWGMHGDPFHYARTTNAVTGAGPIGFAGESPMTGRENGVTYPQFLPLPGGDLLYLFREGSSGNGDLFLNRYDRAGRRWFNLHTNATTHVTFIKGTGWTPNYNAYWNMPSLDAAGRLFLTWTWRYNSDSPAGETGYQTNHDLDYAWSPDAGLTWRRADGTPYALPINERGENGNTNSLAERVLAIPEGWSLINQAGQCLDGSGQPVIAAWWAPGAGTNNHRRQYLVAFPGTNGWQTRQISNRTNDAPSVKKPESEVRDLGRPVIVCDRDDRLIVLYRDNFGSNGLTIAHTLPKARDPERRSWTTFDLTTANLGVYEPVIDAERWARDNVLHVLYQPAQGLGYTPPANTAAEIGVLEWDTAAWFAHRPELLVSFVHGGRDAAFSFETRPGWSYRLEHSADLAAWGVASQFTGAGSLALVIQTNIVAGPRRFWRVAFSEGGLDP